MTCVNSLYFQSTCPFFKVHRSNYLPNPISLSLTLLHHVSASFSLPPPSPKFLPSHFLSFFYIGFWRLSSTSSRRFPSVTDFLYPLPRCFRQLKITNRALITSIW